MSQRVLGILGGSGLYAMEGLSRVEWKKVASPWGEPSDEVLHGELEGVQVRFLPRHGRGHRLSPTEINYRANIDALKRTGVTDLLSLSAVGSLREDLPPRTFVIVDQFVDKTFYREKSFFGEGMVAHVSMAKPVCGRLGEVAFGAAKALGISVVKGATYLAMEGPQFSTLAESKMYRAWGCDVIGMTNMPEAKLAREAEICYATVAMVTDFDCWHPNHEAVTVNDVIAVLMQNADHARALVKALAKALGPEHQPCPVKCDVALDTALITAPEARNPATLKKLDAIVGRVLGNRA